MDRSLLNDATTTDENPTPGYMLNEIARTSFVNCICFEYACAKQSFCAIDCRSDDGKLQRKCAAARVFDVKTDAQTSQCEMEVLGDYQGKVFIGGAKIRMGNLSVIR